MKLAYFVFVFAIAKIVIGLQPRVHERCRHWHQNAEMVDLQKIIELNERRLSEKRRKIKRKRIVA